jgi:ABC-type antimicrobial peptide transport system permease subunit
LILTVLGFRNSFRKPVRTALSILGIALCIMLILAMAAVSQRYTTVVSQSYSIYSTNVVVVSRATFLLEGLPIGGTLPETTASQIAGLKGISSVTPMLLVVDFKQLVPINITIGIPLQNFTMFAKTVPLRLTGSYPASADQAVVGEYIARDSNLTVGSVMKQGDTILKVSGIVSTSNLILENAVIMPLETAQTTQGYDGFVSAFLVSSSGGASAASTEDLIGSIDAAIPGVEALNPAQSEVLTSPLVSSVSLINGGVDSFSELVAILFVAIISMVNITERRDEFLTIRAIGSSYRSLLKIGVAEVGLIAFAGVLLGLLLSSVAIGWVFWIVISVPMQTTIPQFFQLVPLSTILYASLGIIAIGVLVGSLVTATMTRNLK